MSAAVLARQLLEVLDDHLVPARRLADADTWVGPAARDLYDDLHSLHRCLQDVAEAWMALGHESLEA